MQSDIHCWIKTTHQCQIYLREIKKYLKHKQLYELFKRPF